MQFKTDIEAMILGVLQAGPLHGYAIVRAIRAKAQGVLKLGEGQLYPILHRLQERELLTSEWEFQEGKPPRKVYGLSEEGKRALDSRRKEWSAFSRAVEQVLEESPRATRQTREAKGHA